jgi:transposase-like protein
MVERETARHRQLLAGPNIPIREHMKCHTQGLEDLAVEMLARGLSVRDIEDAFKDESGRLLLSKTAVSQLGEPLWEDYQAFAQRGAAQETSFALEKLALSPILSDENR